MKLSIALPLFLSGVALAGPIQGFERRQAVGSATAYTQPDFAGQSVTIQANAGENECWNAPQGFKYHLFSMRIDGRVSCNLYTAENCEGKARATIGRDAPDLATSHIGHETASMQCKGTL